MQVTRRALVALLLATVSMIAVGITPAAAATAPGPVADLVVISGNGYLTASWSPPATDGGSPIVAYSVVATKPGGTLAGWTNLLPDATSASVAGLVNGTTYTVYVLAWNAIANSAATTTGTPLSSGPAATTPPQPRDLQVSFASLGFHGVTARWTAPPGDGGAPIVAYSMVTLYGKPPYLVTRWTHVGPHARQAVCSDCDANVVSVFAWNNKGSGTPAQFGIFPH